MISEIMVRLCKVPTGLCAMAEFYMMAAKGVASVSVVLSLIGGQKEECGDRRCRLPRVHHLKDGIIGWLRCQPWIGLLAADPAGGGSAMNDVARVGHGLLTVSQWRRSSDVSVLAPPYKLQRAAFSPVLDSRTWVEDSAYCLAIVRAVVIDTQLDRR